MRIDVQPWVSTRTYPLKNISSISYIFDEKNHICFVLKGKISDLWGKIVDVRNYDILCNFAAGINMKAELQELLYELQQKELILCDSKFIYESNKYLTNRIKKDDKNYPYFKRIKKNLCIENDYLPDLYLLLNYNCNLKCRHCFIDPDDKIQQIKFEVAKQIIDEAYNLGVLSIYLTGGECTLNKDFLKISRYIRTKHLKLHILTNAQKFYDDKELLDSIISIFPNSIQISLYSMDANVHDEITGEKGSYHKTVEVINYLRKKNIYVEVACFQMKYNVEHYKKVREYALSVGAEFNTGVHFLCNDDNSNSDAQISLEDMEKYFLENYKSIFENDKFKKEKGRICSAGIKKLCITPGLDILPCVYFNYVLGNYNNISITDVRRNIIPEFSKIFLTQNLKDCFKYDYCQSCIYCSRHCKDFMSKSQILCDVAKARHKAYLFHNKNKAK